MDEKRLLSLEKENEKIKMHIHAFYWVIVMSNNTETSWKKIFMEANQPIIICHIIRLLLDVYDQKNKKSVM